MHDNSEILQKQRTDYGVQTKIYIAEAESKKNIAVKYDYGVQQALRAVKWHQLTIIESH